MFRQLALYFLSGFVLLTGCGQDDPWDAAFDKYHSAYPSASEDSMRKIAMAACELLPVLGYDGTIDSVVVSGAGSISRKEAADRVNLAYEGICPHQAP